MRLLSKANFQLDQKLDQKNNNKKLQTLRGERGLPKQSQSKQTDQSKLRMSKIRQEIRQDVNIGDYNMCRLEGHSPVKVAQFWKKAIQKGIVLEHEGGGDGGSISVSYKGQVIGEEWYGRNPVPLWHKIAEVLK